MDSSGSLQQLHILLMLDPEHRGISWTICLPLHPQQWERFPIILQKKPPKSFLGRSHSKGTNASSPAPADLHQLLVSLVTKLSIHSSNPFLFSKTSQLQPLFQIHPHPCAGRHEHSPLMEKRLLVHYPRAAAPAFPEPVRTTEINADSTKRKTKDCGASGGEKTDGKRSEDNSIFR